MSTLDYFIDTIEKLSDQLNSHEFKSPGMFTNAMVNSAAITDLLKDTNEAELSLYRKTNTYSTVNEKLFERVDGKSYFVDEGNAEYIDCDTPDRRAVIVPKLTASESSSEINSSPTKTRPEIQDANKIYDSLVRSVNKLPNPPEDFIDQIRSMKAEYDQLQREVGELESKYEQQRRISNNALGVSSDTSTATDEMDIDELTRIETEEVERLERLLQQYKQRDV